MANTYENGTFIVGVDIAAGTYRAPGLIESTSKKPVRGSWKRLRNFNGEEDIIAIHVGTGPFVVEILATDKGFQTRACGPWTKIG